MKKLFVWALVLILQVAHHNTIAEARVRDDEIELLLAELSEPIFKSSGLEKNKITLHLLFDNDPNAFVMDARNIFVHSGLIVESDTPETLLGVIAHESGHIANGHIVQRSEEASRATKRALLGTVVSMVAGVASQSSDVFAGGVSGSFHIARQGLYSFTRVQERAADQAALRYLREAGVSADGMVRLFKSWVENERVFYDSQSFSRSHPLSRERLDLIQDEIKRHPINDKGFIDKSKRWRYEMARAKLAAFTTPVNEINTQGYQGDALCYVKAIEAFRRGKLKNAVTEIDKLIAKYPTNPFFHELKAQFLFEHGHIPEAISSYKKTLQLDPKLMLARIDLAKALLVAQGRNTKLAISLLESTTNQEFHNPEMWRLLARAYGMDGDKVNSYLASAFEAVLHDDIKRVKRFHELAKKKSKTLSKGSVTELRLKDIENIINNART